MTSGDEYGNIQDILLNLCSGDVYKFQTPKKCLRCKSLLISKSRFSFTSSIIVLELEPDVEGNNNNSSDFYFPSKLVIGSTEYTLVARIYSTEPNGAHFGARVLRSNGVYKYDDMSNKGYAQLQETARGFEGRNDYATVAFYVVTNFKSVE